MAGSIISDFYTHKTLPVHTPCRDIAMSIGIETLGTYVSRCHISVFIRVITLASDITCSGVPIGIGIETLGTYVAGCRISV